MEKSSLMISTWNINGFSSGGHSKFNDPDFVSKICESDIICLMEMHCDLELCPELYGYKSLHIIRSKSKNSRKRFGGLSVYVKSCIRDGILFLKHETSDYIWLKLKKEFFGMKYDIFLCYMYNPPAESPYTKSLSLDYFDLLEKEIAEYSLHGKLIVGGDLNARTGNASDFIVNDNSNHLPLFNDYISDDSINSRCNKDTFISTRGRQLNELCIQSGMRILNGRCLGDTLGNFTSYQPAGNSVIDYFIVSDSLLPYINFF